ncbi:metallophosphoesterase [Magnetospirillum molischianum]|uniref:Calcineurin-like phosphoesterase domain-containing protein n=1 Tax=Magnetospirillum molischianum DSM 120 TaxID=1150626 RepID=H8FYA6_MAGML|nr:metallophosphoesterase [Magnetospirillum molischianum]CCG43344.1 conserved hypothetical protein [Magnetospirillum molischianum DSM 120]
MKRPYALLADLHFHNWSTFSTTNADGVNSRLAIQCAEMRRAGQELLAAGGNLMVLAGDIFHVRGSISPTVLNPVLEVVRDLRGAGVGIVALPGNHDLEGKESDRVGNAVRALADAGVRVCDEPEVIDRLALVPWHSSTADLLNALDDLNGRVGAGDFDVILHAPIDGVIPGLPSHGLTAEQLAGFGFRRVFAGHYHDHKDFGNGVFSIGATTQQTWGDVGTRAGFLIVSDDVRYRASHAPSFIDITPDTPPADIPFLADGNYVRLKLEDVTETEIKIAREELMGMGAKGGVIHATRKTEVSRTGVAAKSGVTLEASVTAYVVAKSFDRPTELAAYCDSILTEARSAA